MNGIDCASHLVGTLVELRPLTTEDWEPLFAVARDPLIWAWHPAHDRWQEPVFRRFFDEALTAGGGLIAIDRANGAVIGSSRYSATRAESEEIEIGWTFLARSHWGGRYNGEMKVLMLAHAFRFVPRAIFLVGEGNIRSRSAMERIGARLTDRRHSAVMAGQPVTHVIYAIDRDDLPALMASRGM